MQIIILKYNNMKTKEGKPKISKLKELIKQKASSLHDEKKYLKDIYHHKAPKAHLEQTKNEIMNLRYETRHLYIVYGALRGIERDKIERIHRLAKPLNEGLISQLMAKYL